MTTTQKPSYRKTKSGEWVVFGPASAVHVGPVAVAKKDGTTKVEQVASVGKTFTVDGVACVYGYLATKSAGSGGGSCTCGLHRSYRACRTGGNCSSFGSGRSCGGCDCDGY